MDFQAKLIFTVAVLVVGIAVCFIDPKGNNAGSDRLWQLGKDDPFRNLACREDGTLHKHTKPGILVMLATWLLILWFTIPGQ